MISPICPASKSTSPGGIGTGRFRDVTPLAQAIRIQNDLLDLGELLAPVGDDALLDLAQVLGEVGPTDDEKVVQLVERLIGTGLVPGNELGVRGLLAVEEILTSTETRLCGNDIQARLGASAMLSPTFNLSATGTLLVRYAAVPDPVSQFDSSAEAKIRLARPEEMSIESDISYARSLPMAGRRALSIACRSIGCGPLNPRTRSSTRSRAA